MEFELFQGNLYENSLCKYAFTFAYPGAYGIHIIVL